MLIPADEFMVFALAALALNLTPGNDMLYCLAEALKGGWRQGFAATLGIATGLLVHIGLVAVGLGALLAEHPVAFEAVRWAGVGYLLWLAFKAFRSPGIAPAPAAARRSAYAAWRDGVLVNILNPKIVAFMLAFLPQFIDAERGSPVRQLLLLGLYFDAQATLIALAACLFASTIGNRLTASPSIVRAFSRGTGAIFIALAARLAFDQH